MLSANVWTSMVDLANLSIVRNAFPSKTGPDRLGTVKGSVVTRRVTRSRAGGTISLVHYLRAGCTILLGDFGELEHHFVFSVH